MKHILPATKLFLLYTLVLGLGYPLLIWGLGMLFFPYQATGEIMRRNGQVIGAKRIAQKFVNEKYFWGRPSAVDYNPLPSGGSNLGPTSTALKKAVQERADAIRKASNLASDVNIPQDLLFTSGSGLDPDISPNAALFQIDRVARARAMSPEQTQKLIELVKSSVVQPDLGFLGEERVNVLELNLALDEMTGIPNLPPPPAPSPTPAGA